MEDEQEKAYAPPRSPDSGGSTPAPFPAKLFWGIGSAPMVLSLVFLLNQSEALAVTILLSIIPCSIAGGIIFGWHHRKKGIQAFGFAVLVTIGMLILNTAAALAGCSSGNTFKVH